MAPQPLGCATRSIPDFVRMERRTVLAVNSGERSYEAMPPIASRRQDTPAPYDGERKKRASLEGAVDGCAQSAATLATPCGGEGIQQVRRKYWHLSLLRSRYGFGTCPLTKYKRSINRPGFLLRLSRDTGLPFLGSTRAAR